MGHCVVKASKDEDIYCVWSSIVDAPIVVGDRDEIAEYLVEDYRVGTDRYNFECEQAEKAMARADQYGSSARVFHFAWWDDEEMMVRNIEPEGMLSREDLPKFLRSFLENGEWDTSLLRPFEDDEDDMDGADPFTEEGNQV